MGGKGKKRREKNYKEAHGVGKNRLPPPPVRSSLDVIPAKLRKLMSYTSSGRFPIYYYSQNNHLLAIILFIVYSWIIKFGFLNKTNPYFSYNLVYCVFLGSGKFSVDGKENNKTHGGGSEAGKLVDNNKLPKKEKLDSVSSESKIEDTHETDNFSTEKKKKKRKRKQVEDLRFVAELGAVGSKRKERKKKLLEERKKKHKKAKKEDDLNFPEREEIKFGEVVQAPPKLVNVPKRFGSSVTASQERIRLRTIEAY
ncbi:uncharacterized protein LOC143594589, partial [Bidens hawaiensis]|uniref:uncharacterized protein LOC143594589 n=1 Tax=Bidens hawaiensis TaxID=980011 RepID=UPI0040492DCE